MILVVFMFLTTWIFLHSASMRGDVCAMASRAGLAVDLQQEPRDVPSNSMVGDLFCVAES